MIIKGIEHNNARNLARYLLRAKQNEACRLWELRDSASDILGKSLTDWEMIGRCKTKGSKILYHAHIRICDDERMNEGQWRETIEKLERSLGFATCPRAIVGHEHAQKGLHVHIVWSRYDPERRGLVKLGNDHQHHHRIAREAENEYALRPAVELTKEAKPKERRLSDRDMHAITERGGDRDQLAKLVRAAWASTCSGEEMQGMLRTLKVELVPGDRRDWVVHYKGLKLNPVRLLPEVKTAEFRQRMQDMDIQQERDKQRQAGTAKEIFRRKAKSLLKQDVEVALPIATAARRGREKPLRQRPQPKLRRKLRIDDPGI
jgi:hypothetical protein